MITDFRTTVVNIRGRKPRDLMNTRDFLYVGRPVPRAGWAGSRWANPWRVAKQPFRVVRSTDVPTVEIAVERYESWIRDMIRRFPSQFPVSELIGKQLGCWCVDWNGKGEPAAPCHAVVLARIANGIQLAFQHHTPGRGLK